MSESELSDIDQLVEIEDRTNPDGSVNVTIEGWEKKGEKVKVTFSLIDSIESEFMDWPEPGGDLTDYKFYRLVQDAGLEMRNADLLEREPARAVNGDSWALEVPDKRSRVERVITLLESVVDTVLSLPWKQVVITVFWMVTIFAMLTAIFMVA